MTLLFGGKPLINQPGFVSPGLTLLVAKNRYPCGLDLSPIHRAALFTMITNQLLVLSGSLREGSES